jgi:hypothetical protein
MARMPPQDWPRTGRSSPGPGRELVAHLLYFFYEPRHLPQVRLVRLVAVVGAELVVVVLDAGIGGEVAVEGLEILVRRSRPSVQEQHLHRRGIADPLGPETLKVPLGVWTEGSA